MCFYLGLLCQLPSVCNRRNDTRSRLLPAGVEDTGSPLQRSPPPPGNNHYRLTDTVQRQRMKTLRLLHQVLNGGADVFRCIAAEWKGVDPQNVKDDLRQQAKQVQLARREAGITWSRVRSSHQYVRDSADLLWDYIRYGRQEPGRADGSGRRRRCQLHRKL